MIMKYTYKSFCDFFKTVSRIVHGIYEAKLRKLKIKIFTEEHKSYIAECANFCPRDRSAKIMEKSEQKLLGMRIYSQTIRNIFKYYEHKYTHARSIQ